MLVCNVWCSDKENKNLKSSVRDLYIGTCTVRQAQNPSWRGHHTTESTHQPLNPNINKKIHTTFPSSTIHPQPITPVPLPTFLAPCQFRISLPWPYKPSNQSPYLNIPIHYHTMPPVSQMYHSIQYQPWRQR